MGQYKKGGPDLHVARKSAETQANKTTMERPAFQKACEKAGTPVTKRQASKYLKGRGLAYKA